MSVFANGFLAFHMEVGVKRGRVTAVKTLVDQWESQFRRAGNWPGFPSSMIDRLLELPDVNSAIREGPQSSLLIPLRMVKGIAATSCTLSTIVGEGPVAQAIMGDLERSEITLDPAARLQGVDSPIEFSFRDPDGAHDSLVLYAASRRRFNGASGKPINEPENLILNRYNQSLRDLADQVCKSGGLVSFRPRELGRYDTIENYASLLRFSNQLVLSSRHRIMKDFAKHAGIQTGRGWPENNASFFVPEIKMLADWLLGRMRPGSVVLFHRYGRQDTAFFNNGFAPVLVDAPPGFGAESRAARLQGALMGEALVKGVLSANDASSWQLCCQQVVDGAYQGTDVRPWRYPG